MLVCHCFRVTEAELRRVLEERRLGSLDEAADATGATRGCGCCRPDVEAILGAVLRRRGAPVEGAAATTEPGAR